MTSRLFCKIRPTDIHVVTSLHSRDIRLNMFPNIQKFPCSYGTFWCHYHFISKLHVVDDSFSVLGFSPVSISDPPAFVDASIRGMLIGIAELVLFLCLYLHQDFCWRDRQGSCTTKGSPDDCRPYYRGSYLMFVYLFVSSHFFGPTIYTQFETKKQTPPLLPP